MTQLDPRTLSLIASAQQNEVTENAIYLRLAASMKEEHNRQILEKIAAEESRHASFWQQYTKKTVKPRAWTVFKYTWIARLFGLTFGVKLMERGEKQAQVNYAEITKIIPEARNIQSDEENHEKQLIGLIDEKKLAYIGSIVLGLNDALVELTGALAGFTLALQTPHLIAAVALITGLAASMSMATSEYLSTKSESHGKHPGRAALYTGVAYVGTVILLILPFLLLSNVYVSLAISLMVAAIIIAAFTGYTAIAQDLPFGKRFGEMAGLSFGV
ncbi:MAG: VIT1/CCC1 family protein, partial [Patescibacteria group bacterium]